MSWADLEAAAGATIDGVFEEAFALERTAAPSTDVDARRAPGGPPVGFRGVWSEEHVRRFPDARGHASTDARGFAAGLPLVDLPVGALAPRPKVGDVVVRIATGRRFVVSDIGENGFTRISLSLTGL